MSTTTGFAATASVDPRKLPRLLAGVSLGALVLTLVGWAISPRQFAFSYLTAWVFAVSLAVGGLFWAMLHHVTGAVWSVVIRRIPEQLAFVIVPLSLLALPLLLNLRHTHGWIEHPDAVWEKKKAYLNQPFFIGRTIFFLAAWVWMAWRLRRWSLRHDETGDPSSLRRMRWHSPTGLLILGVTTTFAAFDWLMSLDWHWYSTIFGVVYWAGAIVGSLAVITLFALALRATGLTAITVEHLHDLGKLLFGFTIFWAYVSFSQYFLIWYANLSEETPWYIQRMTGSWRALTLFLAVGHFVLPFLWLLPREAKRTPWRLGVAAGWLVFMHFVDLYWQVMPVLHNEGFSLSWLDLTASVGLTAAVFAWVAHSLQSNRPLPVRDPNLAASMKHHNE
ncbi:MAG: hypothetical protein N2039_14305 [Gemmataceae bacterium]|nr:hypothetical protein [Gemmataceae bacterium]